jgi:calcineurin-like phosphoesterase family protein
MTTWFTADHHFGHTNIIQYVNRPFETVDAMDVGLIQRWNERVSRKDTVYHLGDFCLGNWSVAQSYLGALNGYIYFVLGGHDKNWAKPKNCLPGSKWNILPPLTTRKIEGMEVVLCHYPLLSWEKSHYGSLHLHGHCHGTIARSGYSGDVLLPPGASNGRRVDVGVDCWNFYPVTLDEVRTLVT